MLLSIDTSAGTSVAVVDLAGGTLSEVGEADTRGHAEAIGTMIEQALAAAGVLPGDLSGVVAGMGPGPFTGLRVGIAAARAFAFGIGKPVLPMASHDAVAFGRTAPTLVVTDARRREVAWSVYAAPDADGFPVLVTGPHLNHPEDLDTAVEGCASLGRVDAAQISAASLGMLAERLYAAGRPFGPAEPLYLRAPDVTLSTPKRVTG
ncbi:tRNA (adenosine(37)-N6)-threonylcarbamoyltransferase complex dimerization subunit type 1 TsaB [soil metagenome]